MVPAMRDVFRTAAFEFDLAPGWWCELDRSMSALPRQAALGGDRDSRHERT